MAAQAALLAEQSTLIAQLRTDSNTQATTVTEALTSLELISEATADTTACIAALVGAEVLEGCPKPDDDAAAKTCGE
jgi:hypothetical protein